MVSSKVETYFGKDRMAVITALYTTPEGILRLFSMQSLCHFFRSFHFQSI